jgi:hypothetical protein
VCTELKIWTEKSRPKSMVQGKAINSMVHVNLSYHVLCIYSSLAILRLNLSSSYIFCSIVVDFYVADLQGKHRRLQRILPRWLNQGWLATDGRTEETVPDFVVFHKRPQTKSCMLWKCHLSVIISFWCKNFSMQNFRLQNPISKNCCILFAVSWWPLTQEVGETSLTWNISTEI